jgi:ArsR family transcriptional regulator
MRPEEPHETGDRVTSSLQDFKAQLFRALGHEVRIRLLEELRRGECAVGELQERVGVSGPNVSRHLAVLRAQGLVGTTRDGTSVRYSIVDERIHNLLDDARAIFEDRIVAGAALLNEE